MKETLVLKVEKGNREYCLQCDNDSPLGELYDALNDMRSYVIDIMNKNSVEVKQEEVEEPSNCKIEAIQ